ncbi:MAG TPA: LemA family protein [Piscinibacter sp.]|jgi:LemA protein|uniref:LemA family protein n=1 Tax=Piscinibacter sp. TaxID=1903157 RepID=UPI001B6C2AEA|nr:LemA family protein [Piscinibacter sp.]MBK7531107.1 LemA family protein [Piscinibacter sp.]MBP6542405.1 LemA family protein [Piscinibacter sp.]HNW64062.1 LemA family protein [Piscinibacter sp.]HOY34219.1 LemA family protein [Piscinibacter sp.]HPG80473.1 LemA family protein [Piscinibacter sp.]
MSSQAIVLGLLAAVLLFWAVGAYNRMVSLRNTLLRHFAAVDEQFRSRHALLLQWADAQPAGDAALLDSLRAACRQAEAACSHARSRASNAGALTSLRLAEEILSQARARLPATEGGDDAQAALAAALAEGDTTLAFARRQFNEAVQAYNHAVGQFPTWVIAGMFGFRKASTL